MKTEDILEKLVRYSEEMLCAISLDGTFVKVSEACQHLLGYTSQEMEGRHFKDFVHPDDISISVQAMLQLKQAAGSMHFENRYLHKKGHDVPLTWAATRIEGEDLLYCSAHDASAQQKLREKVAEKDAFYRALIEHGSDMLALIDYKGAFQYVNGAAVRIMGYPPESLLCTNACSFIHPDDRKEVQDLWGLLDTQDLLKLRDFRYKAADGEWRWVEAIVSNQLQNPAIRALVVSSRDITERKTGRLKLEESEQRYRALFENNPDIVIFENREGVVLEVNQAFREVFGEISEHIIGKPIASFLPPEMAAVNEQSLQEALLGSVLRYDLQLPARDSRQLVLDTVKFPVPAGDQVIGAQTIAKDITPIVRSYETIERQAKKLNTIFESITDAFFTLDKNWRYTYINSEFERITGAREEDYVGKHILEVSAHGKEGIFYKQYKLAAETGNSVHFEAYAKRFKKWLECKVFPSDEGLAVYFTDVTEKVKAKQEVEKLSLVASKTDNGVIMTDAAGLTEWVNEGFFRLTGYTLADMAGRKPGAVLQGPETDQETVREIRENLKVGRHFNARLVNYRKSGEKFWVSMDFTPILDDEGKIQRFIAIQRDITYQIETEANLLQLTEHLFQQNKDLQEFTYIVSHNLRAPVVNALGLASLLRKADRTSEVYNTTIAHLQRSLLQMDTVLKDVNMVLSIRDRQDVLEMEYVEVVQVFRQAQMQLQELLLRHQCQVFLDIDPGLEVWANKAYFFSIFFNLLSNAIKYRSASRPLEIRLGNKYNADGSLEISLADNGTGFDVGKAGEDVFKLYKRFHKDKKGRGMGLFLIKAHADAMGWKVGVSSQVGEGTTFLITIPVV